MYLPLISAGDDYNAHRLAFLARGAFIIPLRSLESELMFAAGIGPARLWLPAANASGGDWVAELSLGYGRGLGEDSRGFVDLAVCFEASQGNGDSVEACALGLTLRLGAQWK